MPTLIGIVTDSARFRTMFRCGSDRSCPRRMTALTLVTDMLSSLVRRISARPSIPPAGDSLGALPDEARLRADLQAIVRACRALTYRGGVDADVETQNDIAEEFDLPTSTTVALPS